MCPDKKILSQFLDKELPSTGMDALTIHVAHCDHCKNQISQWQEQQKKLALLNSPLDSSKRELLKKRILEKREEPRVLPFWQKEIPWTYAAGLALVFTLSALMIGRGFNDSGNRAPMVDIHQWDDSSHFTLDSSDASGLFADEDFQETIVIDIDATLSYLGESELLHQANYTGSSRSE